MIVNQDAIGMLYAFVVVICPPKHPVCTDKTKGAIVMREENLGQFACDVKMAGIGDRMTPRLKGRVRARCESHEANSV